MTPGHDSGPEPEPDTDVAGGDWSVLGSELTVEDAFGVESGEERVVDLLAWLLNTETRARIFIVLRQTPGLTSEEIADSTGLYPSTVRESLANLHAEGIVERRKREHAGAGNNPFEYTAIAPRDLVADAVTHIQHRLNAVCNLDRLLDRADEFDDLVRIELRGDHE